MGESNKTITKNMSGPEHEAEAKGEEDKGQEDKEQGDKSDTTLVDEPSEMMLSGLPEDNAGKKTRKERKKERREQRANGLLGREKDDTLPQQPAVAEEVVREEAIKPKVWSQSEMDGMLSMLVDMGFPIDACRRALEHGLGMEEAIERLVATASEPANEVPTKPSEAKVASKAADSFEQRGSNLSRPHQGTGSMPSTAASYTPSHNSQPHSNACSNRAGWHAQNHGFVNSDGSQHLPPTPSQQQHMAQQRPGTGLAQELPAEQQRQLRPQGGRMAAPELKGSRAQPGHHITPHQHSQAVNGSQTSSKPWGGYTSMPKTVASKPPAVQVSNGFPSLDAATAGFSSVGRAPPHVFTPTVAPIAPTAAWGEPGLNTPSGASEGGEILDMLGADFDNLATEMAETGHATSMAQDETVLMPPASYQTGYAGFAGLGNDMHVPAAGEAGDPLSDLSIAAPEFIPGFGGIGDPVASHAASDVWNNQGSSSDLWAGSQNVQRAGLWGQGSLLAPVAPLAPSGDRKFAGLHMGVGAGSIWGSTQLDPSIAPSVATTTASPWDATAPPTSNGMW